MSAEVRAPRVAFVMEQTLGHVTHAKNLRAALQSDEHVIGQFLPIEFATDGMSGHIPIYRSNWTLRAGVRMRRAVRAAGRDGRLDGLFVHTQVPAVLNPDLVSRLPTVISLDATPLQYDELAEHYDHRVGSSRAERAKWKLNRSCFQRARAIVTWAHWTKRSLVEQYGVPPSKVTVIPPGVDFARWSAIAPPNRSRQTDPPVRVLFVGGDFKRKGGPALIEAFRSLRSAGLPVALDLVTTATISSESGLFVHNGLQPNSAELIDLYASADIFCLPTLGDCLPMVLSEAGAMGLPVIATDVGAVGEIVRSGENGLLVPPNDVAALAEALRTLVLDRATRARFGAAGRSRTGDEFDAMDNAHRLLELIIETIDQRP